MCWGGWKGIPISIWSEWVFASTTPRAASECNSAGFPFCSKDDLCLLAHLCHAKQKPYLKEAKIIEKSVVCVLKIKLLHFFHPFASHFPGSSTTPQAAACHEWLKRVIQQQGDIFMGIHDFLNSTAFASQPVLHIGFYQRFLVLFPLVNHYIRNLGDIFTLLLVWVFEQMPCKRKRFNKMGIEREIGHQEYRRGVRNSVGTIEMDELWWWWQIAVTLIIFHIIFHVWVAWETF